MVSSGVALPGIASLGIVTRLLLVRHGQSEWNAAGRWQGQADPPLSALGREQAYRAATALTYGVEAVVTSDLRRAHDTATIMAERLGLDPVSVDAQWRERDVGEFTGLTRGEIEQRWPGILVPATPEIPGGEAPDALLRRACAAVDGVVAAHAGASVLVVSHGGLIRRLEHHLGGPVAPLPNLGGACLDVDESGMTMGPRLLFVDPDDVEVTVPQQL